MSAKVFQSVVFEDGGATFLARVYGNSGSAITQASLSSITCKVFDLDSTTPDTAILTPTVTIASVVYDTLQTGGLWVDDNGDALDSVGYNFAHAMPATAFPTGGHRYRIEYKLTPASGEVFWIVFEATATDVRTS